MQLRRQLTILKRWVWLIVAGTLAAAIASLAVSGALPRMYESESTLIVGQALASGQVDQQQLLASQNLARTYATIATMRPTLERVIDDLELETTWDELEDRVSADAPRDSTLATITVQDRDPDTAAAIANAIAAALIDVSRSQLVESSEAQAAVDENLADIQDQIALTGDQVRALLEKGTDRTAAEDTQLDNLRTRLVSLWQSYSQLLPFSSGASANGLGMISPAVPADEPSSPRVLLNVLLATIAGFVLACALVALLEHLDDTVKTSEDVERLTGWATLGAIGRMPGPAADSYRLVALTYPRSPAAEAYRTLRTNVEFASLDKPPRTLLITSSGPREGKTTTAANLALVFAQAGKKTILVDADLRKPTLHQLFGIDNRHGLTDLLRSTPGIESAAFHPTEAERLMIVPSGALPPNPAELLGSQHMTRVIAWLADQAELVIFDSPPSGAVTDPLVLAAAVDATIYVVEPNRTQASALKAARPALDRVGAHVLGVCLNHRSGSPVPSESYPYPAAEGAANADALESGATMASRRARESRSGGAAP